MLCVFWLRCSVCRAAIVLSAFLWLVEGDRDQHRGRLRERKLSRPGRPDGAHASLGHGQVTLYLLLVFLIRLCDASRKVLCVVGGQVGVSFCALRAFVVCWFVLVVVVVAAAAAASVEHSRVFFCVPCMPCAVLRLAYVYTYAALSYCAIAGLFCFPYLLSYLFFIGWMIAFNRWFVVYCFFFFNVLIGCTRLID